MVNKKSSREDRHQPAVLIHAGSDIEKQYSYCLSLMEDESITGITIHALETAIDKGINMALRLQVRVAHLLKRLLKPVENEVY